MLRIAWLKRAFFKHLYVMYFYCPFTVRIKKKSRVPGVMITQFVEELPEGMSTPDFTRKPIAITIQEGIYDTASDCMLISYIKTYHNIMQFYCHFCRKNRGLQSSERWKPHSRSDLDQK